MLGAVYPATSSLTSNYACPDNSFIVEDDASLRETVQLYIEREDCAVERG